MNVSVFLSRFEQGVRISVSHELCELREQQTAFCDTLEDLMDKNQGPDDETEDRWVIPGFYWN